MNVCEINNRKMNTYLEWSMAAELDSFNLNPEALAGIFSDWINTQLLFRDLIAILPLNMLLTDEMGKILASTPKLLREILHREREDICGQYVSSVLAEYLQEPKQLLPLDEAIMQAAQWRGELKFNDNEYVGVKICPLPLGDSTVSVLLFEPLAESGNPYWKKRLMKMIDDSRSMISRGRLAYGVIHDVKNMVQNLSGNLQCMQMKNMSGENMRARLDMLNTQISEMSRLVNGYLRVGKVQNLPTSYSINAVVHDTVTLISGSVRMNRIEIFEEPAKNLPELLIDGMRIEQVLMNCLENSMEAIVERQKQTAKGERYFGEIYVKTFAADNGGVTICIEDNGVGLSAEQEKRFFEPFFTTKADGHGIGMSYSRAVVELHGGTMRAENRAEGGCRVLISLPLKSMVADKKTDFYEEMANLDW